MAESELLRTFVALPLSADVITQIAEVQRTLQHRCSHGVRWVKPDRIHLTLFFLGEITRARVGPVQAALATVARNIAPFTYQVGGLGVFPNPRRPRVIWVGLQDTQGALRLLHRAVNEALKNIGFPPEKRKFTPHLTLGRVQRRAQPDTVHHLGKVVTESDVGQLAQTTATELVFFRSVLKPTGAEYSRLATFPLGRDR